MDRPANGARDTARHDGRTVPEIHDRHPSASGDHRGQGLDKQCDCRKNVTGYRDAPGCARRCDHS